MKNIALLSDTHGFLEDRFLKHLSNIDEIWHAGDIGSIEIIDKLKKYGVVKAVHGNIDDHVIKTEYKENIFFKCENIKILIRHIGGYPSKYTTASLALINKYKPDLFISGHSHILKVIYDKKYQLLHINPGAAGNYGIHKVKTIVKFSVREDKILNLKIIEVKR